MVSELLFGNRVRRNEYTEVLRHQKIRKNGRVSYYYEEKKIFGSEERLQKVCKCISENNGRLVSSAKITGNISDEKYWRVLNRHRVLGRLVHSIGVCVSQKYRRNYRIYFSVMHGRKDPWIGHEDFPGSEGDGMEQNAVALPSLWYGKGTDDDSESIDILHFSQYRGIGQRPCKTYVQEGFFRTPEQKEEEYWLHRAGMQRIWFCPLWKGTCAHEKGHRKTKRRRCDLAFIGGLYLPRSRAVPAPATHRVLCMEDLPRLQSGLAWEQCSLSESRWAGHLWAGWR